MRYDFGKYARQTWSWLEKGQKEMWGHSPLSCKSYLFILAKHKGNDKRWLAVQTRRLCYRNMLRKQMKEWIEIHLQVDHPAMCSICGIAWHGFVFSSHSLYFVNMCLSACFSQKVFISTLATRSKSYSTTYLLRAGTHNTTGCASPLWIPEPLCPWLRVRITSYHCIFILHTS